MSFEYNPKICLENHNLEIEKLKQENERLREALKVYAVEVNWNAEEVSKLIDCSVAKKALEETK